MLGSNATDVADSGWCACCFSYVLLGYGFTSPMSNIEPKVDTILCRTFNTYEQRLGGSVVVMKKTLVTDPARISAAATTCGKQARFKSKFRAFAKTGSGQR